MNRKNGVWVLGYCTTINEARLFGIGEVILGVFLYKIYSMGRVAQEGERQRLIRAMFTAMKDFQA